MTAGDGYWHSLLQADRRRPCPRRAAGLGLRVRVVEHQHQLGGDLAKLHLQRRGPAERRDHRLNIRGDQPELALSQVLRVGVLRREQRDQVEPGRRQLGRQREVELVAAERLGEERRPAERSLKVWRLTFIKTSLSQKRAA